MISYRITNRTHMTVILEDLGLTFHRGASFIISEEAHSYSLDLRRHNSWFRIERLITGSIRNQPVSQPKPSPTLPPVAPAPASPPQPQPHGLSAFHAAVREMNDKLAQMVELLARPSQVVVSPDFGSSHNDVGFRRTHSAPESEAIFIPSTILPESVEARISVKEEQSDAGNFEEAAAALRAMRKARK